MPVDCLIDGGDIGEMTAEELRRLRADLGLTQQEMADALGISLSRLGDYERGRVRGKGRGDRSAVIPRYIELAVEALRVRHGDRGRGPAQ